jgi:hypothetical protein
MSKANARLPLGKTISWCGGFALWCLREAGLCSWDWVPKKGFIWHEGQQRLASVERPEPGDVAYFAAGQHYAIVASVDGELVTLINGNGRAPLDAPNRQTWEGVTETERPVTDAAAYYSIASLVERPEPDVGAGA